MSCRCEVWRVGAEASTRNDCLMKDFHELIVWDRAHKLALEIYACTRDFPKDEQYGLTSQMRRAASSIPTNIAEGSGRGSQADFARFLVIAIGSASELEYELILSRDLNLIPDPEFRRLTNEVVSVRKMLITLARKINPRGFQHPTSSS